MHSFSPESLFDQPDFLKGTMTDKNRRQREKKGRAAVTLRTEIMGNLDGCGERHTTEL